MRKILFLPLFALIILGTACGAFVFKGEDKETSKDITPSKEKVVLQLLKFYLENQHYHQLSINDEFGENAMSSLLKASDKGKRFFIKKDIERFEKIQINIDDEFAKSSLTTFEIYMDIIETRENWVKSVVDSFFENPIQINSDKTIQLNEDSLDYCKNKKELKERWEDYLTFSVLEKMYQIDKKNDSSEVQLSKKELEIKAREDVGNKFKDWIKRLDKMERSDRFSLYVNALLSVYDPHTNYYPPKDKEDFDIQFSGKLEGIGATLTSKDGYIKVSKIVPGSASWRQGELSAGDLILEVAQGEEEPVDVYDMRLDKAVQLIRGPKGTEVRLTVKKVDGQVQVIPIIRDVVIIEETYAKSLILQEDNDDTKYGYLNLESFYADFQDRNGRHSSDDVLKELEALKASGAEGLILDLRNNGGGSLSDAIKMVGFFIEKGPVVQVDGVNKSPEVYPDYDPRVQFKAPLVVMVNNFSASASEIFAAAIQDYNRGVIVGVNTFGKGTVQNFQDLDALAKQNDIDSDLLPLGSLKQTIAKFYRINGGATQLRGVEPDIVLPEPYMFIEIGEKEYDFPLPWSSIPKSRYDQFDRTYQLDSLIVHSHQRIERDSFFNVMEEHANHIKTVQERGSYPLDFEKLSAQKSKTEEKNKKFSAKKEAYTDWEVSFHQRDLETMQNDSIVEDRMTNFKEMIIKDGYVRESLKILKEIPK